MTKNVPGNFAGEGSGPIKQHQTLARGGSPDAGSFDIQPLASLSRGNGYSGSSNVNSDGNRATGKPIKHTRGRSPAQAAPDHGGY